MKILVQEEDIQSAGPGIIGNPIARAMSRATGARWRVWDGRVAQEMSSPYRVVKLPASVGFAWDSHSDLSQMAPFAFEVELDPEEMEITGLGGLSAGSGAGAALETIAYA